MQTNNLIFNYLISQLIELVKRFTQHSRVTIIAADGSMQLIKLVVNQT